MIEEATGRSIVNREDVIRVSGALEHHYAPAAKVVLDDAAEPGDGLIALSSVDTPDGVIRLAAPINSEDFARQLYGALREADAQEIARVVVLQPAGSDIAIAIRDRLQRAAAGR